MHDALLNRTLRFTVVGIISTLCLAALILCYQGLLDGIWGNFANAAIKIAWGLGAGVAGLILVKYRTDLIDT
jgi:hypothetical protein